MVRAALIPTQTRTYLARPQCHIGQRDRAVSVAGRGQGAVEDTALFYATDGFGAAQKLLLDLLAILDELATTSRAGGVR